MSPPENESDVSGPAACSTITCPLCARRELEAMPTDACLFFYECKGCGALLRPKPGDCCVFCSYGDAPCPPVQAERSGRPGGGPCCQ
jgi:hypothetical protein